MAISYKIYRNGTFLKEVSELTATITGLTPNTTYTFQVSETDGEDESAKSTAVEFTTGSIAVNSITLNASTKSIAKGSTFQLSVTFDPTNATDKTITRTSSAPTIASVSTAGLITGLKSGTAKITATAHNGKVATCDVTVTPIVKTPTTLAASDVTATSVKLTWVKGV
ncbi:Ig-like domain-containing protein [Enterococcus avium]|uniref:Ig-like domain-containing protein n=1 Tax=Enterococcus avium TaxID=33945 RepID=UPI00289125A0|nr:Ig-like domain-containing protein [Enterococcus avium]MDT2415004.1 Ig-like domain-containing protein [Enterococcus avium]MDT2475594.1 Ig-like domain-containing protein [Enterococcus avium]